MDKQISSEETRKARIGAYIKYAAIVAAIGFGLWWVRGLLSKKIEKEKLHIVKVERGDIQNTLTATGTVVPAVEREINSPVTTEIKNVVKSNGDFVEKGDVILELDQEFTQLAYDQLYDELQLKRNNIDKLKLEYDKNLRDLDYQTQIKSLQVDELTAQVKDQKRLNNVGGATMEEVEQAELQLKVSNLEKSMLKNELDYRKSVNVNEKRGLELEYTIQEKRLAELKRKLRETNVRAPQSGVITFVNEDLGRKVQEGETIVKLANLEKFRVEASSSDRNSSKIQLGMPVKVRINRKDINGTISNILPAVENNTIRFNIALEDPNSDVLRPNIRAEVLIITDSKKNVLRIKNGPAFKGANSQYVYVVEGDLAVKRRISKGLQSSDFVEIVNNLSEGENVIISDMKDYDHLDEFKIIQKMITPTNTVSNSSFSSNEITMKSLSTSFNSLVFLGLWLFLLFHLPISSLSAQDTWSFEEVLVKAEDQSIFRHQAVADNKIAQSRWNFYKTNLNPGVTLDLLAPNFTKSSREIIQPDGSIVFQSVSQNNSSVSLGIQQRLKSTGGTVFLQSQLQRFDDFSLDAKQYNGIPVRIGIAQPIFGFNELKWADQIEPLFLTEAERKYIIDMEDIHLRATIAFFDVLMAQVNEKIAQSNSEVNEKLLEIANERFSLGKASKNDLLQLELEYKSAVKDLSKAKFQVEFTKGALQTFLGGDKTQDMSVLTPTPRESDISMDIERAISEAKANRPEIISFQRLKLEADRDIKQAEREFGVKADLFASFGLARGSDKIGDIYGDPITEQQVQLGVSIPILDWGRRKAAVGQAKAQKELIEQQIAQDNLDFENDIVQSVYNWEQLQSEVKIQEEIQSVSLERFEISRQRYILGDISITDLTIAQREKDQAQRDYVNTLREYWITYYQIRKLTGYDFEFNKNISYIIN